MPWANTPAPSQAQTQNHTKCVACSVLAWEAHGQQQSRVMTNVKPALLLEVCFDDAGISHQ